MRRCRRIWASKDNTSLENINSQGPRPSTRDDEERKGEVDDSKRLSGSNKSENEDSSESDEDEMLTKRERGNNTYRSSIDDITVVVVLLNEHAKDLAAAVLAVDMSNNSSERRSTYALQELPTKKESAALTDVHLEDGSEDDEEEGDEDEFEGPGNDKNIEDDVHDASLLPDDVVEWHYSIRGVRCETPVTLEELRTILIEKEMSPKLFRTKIKGKFGPSAVDAIIVFLILGKTDDMFKRSM